MTELVQLNSAKHQDLKVKPYAALAIAKMQHALTLRVNEIGQAISSFPVFITRIDTAGDWGISAMTSLEVKKNLFVENDVWMATYTPNMMRTYPLFLMQDPEDKTKPVIGVNENSDAFEKDKGVALFDNNGKPSLYHSQMKVMLENDIKNSYHTFQFLKKMQEFDLIKAMDVNIFYEDNRKNTLKGLHTIDEAKLALLSSEDFEVLRKENYLPAIYGMLVSIFQLNNLIGRHNLQKDALKVMEIKMEVSK